MSKNKCNHLADGHGFYVKIVQSYRQYYSPAGAATGTDDGFHSRPRSTGNIAYCEQCDKRLGAITFENGLVTIGETS